MSGSTLIPGHPRQALACPMERIGLLSRSMWPPPHARPEAAPARSPARAGWVERPDALARKSPNAGRDQIDLDRLTRQRRRRHRHESVRQRTVTDAVRRAGISKRASCHTLRHAFATYVLEDGHDIRTVQEPLGRRDVSTTMIYTHVLNRGPEPGRSDVHPVTCHAAFEPKCDGIGCRTLPPIPIVRERRLEVEGGERHGHGRRRATTSTPG